jgi:hypothetical protein
MLGGVCTAWLVLLAPGASTPLDPFAAGSRAGGDVVAVRGDLVDPFARPRMRASERSPAVARRSSFDLKDPFAPASPVGRRAVPAASLGPDLADPFAHPTVADPNAGPEGQRRCATPRASNGAAVQRPDGLGPPRCDAPARGGAQLLDPFG